MIWNWPTSLTPRLRSSINATTYRMVDQIESLEAEMKELDDTRLRRLGRSQEPSVARVASTCQPEQDRDFWRGLNRDQIACQSRGRRKAM